jgi:hypothetical protein
MKQLCLRVAGRRFWLVLLATAWLLGAGAPASRAQAPAWQSVQNPAHLVNSYSFGRVTATDASGNVFLAGTFAGTVRFGSISLTSAGDYDIYVAKWSPVANGFVWAQQAGGPLAEEVQSLVLNGSSIYVSGTFGSPAASFGPITLANAGQATTTGTQDIFVAKLTDTGPTASFAWAQRAGGAGFDYVYGLASTGSSVYLVGEYNTATSFGSISLPATGSISLYVAKLTDAGATSSFVWVQQVGTAVGTLTATTIATVGASLYISGYFYGRSVAFGPTTLTNTDPSGYSGDTFVAKLLDAGPSASIAWVTQLGGASFDRPQAIAASGSALYVAGLYSGSPFTAGSSTLPMPAGGSDIYLVRLTDTGSAGTVGWAQRAGGGDDDVPFALAIAGQSVYMVGVFRGSTADFGPATLTNPGISGTFLTKVLDLGSSGSFAWALAGGGQGYCSGTGLAISGSRLFVAGTAVGTPASFGALVIPASVGSLTAYLASAVDASLPSATTPLAPAAPGLYPNPAHQVVNVPLAGLSGPALFTLTDALGRVALSRTAALPPAGSHFPLDVSGVPPGVYVLLVQAGPLRFARRLVIN